MSSLIFAVLVIGTPCEGDAPTQEGAHALIIAEHKAQKLSPSLLPVVTAASQLCGRITVLVAGALLCPRLFISIPYYAETLETSSVFQR